MDTALEIVENLWRSNFHFVMVAHKTTSGGKNCRHLKLHKDGSGFYVRLGKRAKIKRYLHNFVSYRIVDKKLNLVVFLEY